MKAPDAWCIAHAIKNCARCFKQTAAHEKRAKAYEAIKDIDLMLDREQRIDRLLAFANEDAAYIAQLTADAEKWRDRDTPEIIDFMVAIHREAIHQRERWGTAHDAGKSAEEWLWLIAYLATKASQAHRYGDTDKYLHHIITCGAACLNWHAGATGENTEMRPGTKHAAAESGK